MNKKLYHLFHVSPYKGGELHSGINLTLEDVVDEILNFCQWDDDFAECVYENNESLTDEAFEKLSHCELIDYASDEVIEDFAEDILYPGNIYAYDMYSDYECYTTNEEGKLVDINPIKEPEFCNILRKKWKKYYKNE